MDASAHDALGEQHAAAQAPTSRALLDEIEVEDLAVDGICGVY